MFGFSIGTWVAIGVVIVGLIVFGGMSLEIKFAHRTIAAQHVEIVQLKGAVADAQAAAKRNGDEVLRLTTEYARVRAESLKLEDDLKAAQMRAAASRRVIVQEIIHDPHGGDPLPPAWIPFSQRLFELDRSNPAGRPR